MSAPLQICLLYFFDSFCAHHIQRGARITDDFFTEAKILTDPQLLSLRIQNLSRHLHQLPDFFCQA